MVKFAYGGFPTVLKGIILSFFLNFSATAQQLTLFALGDSLTAGYGLPQGDGFTPQLENWLTQQGYDIRVVNGGVSGDTTAGGASRLDWVLDPETDIVLVNLGGNDMLRGIPPAQTQQNLQRILDNLTQKKIPTVLVGIPGPGNFGESYKTEFDSIFPTLAKMYKIPLYSNFFAAITEKNSMSRTSELYLQADRLHPNALGVQRIVSDLGPFLRQEIDAVAAKN